MSTRTTSATNITNSQAPAQRLGVLVELDFAGGVERFHDGVGDRIDGGNTYTGAGNLGKIGDITESVRLGAEKLELELSGLDPTFLAKARSENIRGRGVTIRVQWRFPDAAPSETRFVGVMDALSGRIADSEGVLRLTCKSVLARLEETRGNRRSDAEQRRIDATDTFWFYAAAASQRRLTVGGFTIGPQGRRGGDDARPGQRLP